MNENTSSGYPSNRFILSKNSSTTQTHFSTSFIGSLLGKIWRLKKLICYNGYYTAYLLGQHTEEEFIEISKKFIDKSRWA